ncbi:MAG TPA: hypothetical protein PLM79_07875 [Syntrophobacteraceae bacterium]|nr:hypothetical protein [Syntrophobacteraceae bacterium]
MEDYRNQELAFLGKMAAGFTHEVKNVLAIIRENAGLIEDILTMAPAEAVPNLDRVLRALSAIRDQSGRGVELSNRLNRFAHCADQPRAHIELNETLAQFTLLVERFARLKEVTLTLHRGESGIEMETRPVGLQLALFGVLECCWNSVSSLRRLDLKVESEPNQGVVEIVGKGEDDRPVGFHETPETVDDWARVVSRLDALGAKVERGPAVDVLRIVFPLRSP